MGSLKVSLTFKILETIVFHHWCEIIYAKDVLKRGCVEKGSERNTVKWFLSSRNMSIFFLLSAFLYSSDFFNVRTTFTMLIKLQKTCELDQLILWNQKTQENLCEKVRSSGKNMQ